MSVQSAESFILDFEVNVPGGASAYRLEWERPDKVYMIVTGAESLELAQQGGQVFVKEPTGPWVEVPEGAATLPVPDWNQEFGLLLLGEPLELLDDTIEQGLPAYHIRAQLSGREYLDAVSQVRNSDFQQNLADAGVDQVHAVVDFFISKQDFLPRRQVATVIVAGGGQQASLRVEAFYGQFNEPINFPGDLPLTN